MSIAEIAPWNLAVGYGLLLIPMGILLWLRVPMVGETAMAAARMTVQLLLVGLYLKFVFALDNPALNALWILVMIGAADASIARGSGLRLRRFALPIFGALVIGTLVPLFWFIQPVLGRPNLLEAQYVVPIGGMILGNCLRSDIIAIRAFYEGIRRDECAFLNALAQGATLSEATQPYLARAARAALAPTVATMATIGLVSLPGMMTGVILGGVDPAMAVRYQIVIMLAILAGSALTVVAAIRLTARRSFSAYGTLDLSIFREAGK